MSAIACRGKRRQCRSFSNGASDGADIKNKETRFEQALVRRVARVGREVVRLPHDGGKFRRGEPAREGEMPKGLVKLRCVARKDGLPFSERRWALMLDVCRNQNEWQTSGR